MNLNPFKINKKPIKPTPLVGPKTVSGVENAAKGNAIANKVKNTKVLGGNIRGFAKRYADLEDL